LELELFVPLSKSKDLDLLKIMKESVIDDERLKKIKTRIVTSSIKKEKAQTMEIKPNILIQMHENTIYIIKRIYQEDDTFN